MQSYNKHFIQFALEQGALKFGEFTLKSGRKSPYFFNAGLFNTGESLALLAGFYAQVIKEKNLEFDMVFGPAYKGIPLACATSIALAANYAVDKPFAFNRKEAKNHGEGGNVVGADLRGNVLLIDDVITAGTAIGECMPLIEKAGATLSHILIALDRQERGQGSRSAIAEIAQKYQVQIHSIITLEDLMNYLHEHDELDKNILSRFEAYRKEYGVGIIQ